MPDTLFHNELLRDSDRTSVKSEDLPGVSYTFIKKDLLRESGKTSVTGEGFDADTSLKESLFFAIKFASSIFSLVR